MALIDKQTAIDALWQVREMLDSQMDVYLRKGMPIIRSNTKIERNRVEYDIHIIENLPSVQPERKKGKWIRWYETKEDETGIEYIPHCRCSECGTEYDPHSSKFVSFCNVCGAKMEEGE